MYFFFLIRTREQRARATLSAPSVKRFYLIKYCSNQHHIFTKTFSNNPHQLLHWKFFLATRRKKSDYNSKNTSHAFVAGFVLAILVKKSYILSRDPFMLLEQLCLAKIVRTSPYYDCKKPILFQYEFSYNRGIRPRLLSNVAPHVFPRL